MILYLLFLSYVLQFLVAEVFFVSFILSCYILYDQIILKKDDLFIIFLVLLPELVVVDINGLSYRSSIRFLINIDLMFVASIFSLCRNYLEKNVKLSNLIFFLYTVILIYSFVNLIILYLAGATHNQGLSYAFKAVLYISPLFMIYNNDWINFKNQVLRIIIASIFLIYIREILFFNGMYVRGHLIFMAVAFIPFVIFYKFKISNLLLYLPSLFFITQQNITVITIFLLSHLLFFFRKLSIFFNKISLIFLINFHVIVLIIMGIVSYFIKNFFPESLIYSKFILDRMPLYIASLEKLDFLSFELSPLVITGESIFISATTGKEIYWSSGSHNYFLTMSLKLGLIPYLVLLFILNLFLIKIYNRNKHDLNSSKNFNNLLFISLLSSFAVISSTGNGYAENIGYLFFLLLGCINSVISSNKKII